MFSHLLFAAVLKSLHLCYTLSNVYPSTEGLFSLCLSLYLQLSVHFNGEENPKDSLLWLHRTV
jgi:hypothetical protein